MLINNKYKIIGEIGKGGMSTVYLATDIEDNKKYAVKEINTDNGNIKDIFYLKNIISKSEIIMNLSHPGIVEIKEVIQSGYTVFIVMENVEGQSLDRIVEEFGAQSEDNVKRWSVEIADALLYLHKQYPPIIYQDVKPGNIMLMPDGNVKIIDFGIAKEYNREKYFNTTILGTRGYAPPEQYNGRTDNRSDIYALGMTMYHLLTGSLPESWEGPYAVNKINPLITEEMAFIVSKAMEPDPEARYQSCSELIFDLMHPENAGGEERKIMKKHFRLFSIMLCLTVIAIICSAALFIKGNLMNKDCYEDLIGKVNALEDYENAIEIYPGRAEAYIKILETYEERGNFGPEESNDFLKLYNRNKKYMSSKDNNIFYLNYKAGLMYFNYYNQKGENENLAERIQKSYPFFYENHKNKEGVNNISYSYVSESYYYICRFYREYLLRSSTIEEAYYKDYKSLFHILKESVNNIKNASSYDRLLLYNSIFIFIYDQRYNLNSVGYNYDFLINFMYEIYQNTLKLNVKNNMSHSLKKEIEYNYRDYMHALDIAYGKDKGGSNEFF